MAARTVMTGRFDSDFAYTPVGNATATGKQARWELHNIFRYTDDGRLAEEWVQTDTFRVPPGARRTGVLTGMGRAR